MIFCKLRKTYPLSLKCTEISSIGPKTWKRFRKSALDVPSQILPTYITRRSSTGFCCLELVCCHLRGLLDRCSADDADPWLTAWTGGFLQVRLFFWRGLGKLSELELELELDSWRRLRLLLPGELLVNTEVLERVVIREETTMEEEEEGSALTCTIASVLEWSPMLELELELRLRIPRVRIRGSESVEPLLDTRLGTPLT